MILITGTTGFLGQYIVKFAPTSSNLLTHSRSSESEVCFDLKDSFTSLLGHYPIRAIIHNAAMSQVDACEKNEQEARLINVKGTEQLLDVAAGKNAQFIYISTDQVFDGRKGNYVEEDIPAPINIYGQTKFDAEKIVSQYENSLILRVALIYGKPLGGNNNFTNVMIQKLSSSETVSVFTDQFRSPVWVMDLVKTIWYMQQNQITGLFHVGGPESLSRSEMGRKLCDAMGLERKLLREVSSDTIQTLAPRPKNCSLNSQKLYSTIHYSFTPFDIAIRKSYL